MAHKYKAEIRPNNRGGYEIGDPGTPAGMGVGNYATAADAMSVACYSFDRSEVRAWREPVTTHTAKPARPPQRKHRHHTLTPSRA